MVFETLNIKYEIPVINREIPNKVPAFLEYLSPKNPEKNVVIVPVIRPANDSPP